MGGAIEDLWPFNEEIVARAIYESQIPIISAIGHETDFTISDFVADLRAPTPSAAAEIATADVYEIKRKLDMYQDRCKQALRKKLELIRLKYEKIINSRVFTNPTQKIKEHYIQIDIKTKQLENLIGNKLKENKNKEMSLVAKLDTLSPLKTLTRGYSVIEHKGKIIKSIKQLQKDDEIQIRLEDGNLRAKVID